MNEKRKTFNRQQRQVVLEKEKQRSSVSKALFQSRRRK